MVPAVNTAATLDGYVPPSGDGSVAATVTQSRASLTVVTAEGDRVTLSSSQSVESAAIGYDARGHIGGQDVAAASRSVSRAVAVSVEGDLSADERQDLRAVARAFQAAVKDGSATTFFDKVDARDLDSLASLSGDYQTTSASVFAVSTPGPSALPARSDPNQIGTPPLAKAIDLLRSIMLAFRSSRADEPPAASTQAAAPSPKNGGIETPPSNVVEA
ncbi:MAG: hypothetical protein JNM38_12245 [Acidobacteria bacterium]|jgi:hypothetical protein|nr:hypothetical protein [Acidobacteriota bacterium]